ncbi:hypothetical protein AAVH_43628, partial [Aphelenchoides avenae]
MDDDKHYPLFAAFVNRTLLRNAGLLPYVDAALIFELLCLLLSYPVNAFAVHIALKTSLLHRNFVWILYHLFHMYWTSLACRIVLICVQLGRTST